MTGLATAKLGVVGCILGHDAVHMGFEGYELKLRSIVSLCPWHQDRTWYASLAGRSFYQDRYLK